MSDIEERLRQLGDRLDAASTSPELPNPRTLRRIRARQGLVMFGSLGATLALIATLVVLAPTFHISGSTGGVGGGGTNGAAPLSPSPPRTWLVHRVGAGVTIATPKNWVFVAQNPKRPRVVNFKLGTWRFPSKGPCGATAAFDVVPPNGMFLWMFQAGNRDPALFQPRPTGFKLGPLQGPFECMTRKAHLILFRQHHRFFQIFVRLGPHAPETLRHEVISSLNSITILPR
jgi:hypothetical protein